MRKPHTQDHFHAPPEFLSVGTPTARAALPLGGCVDPIQLRRFAQRMAALGQRVQLARMGFDRIYAFDCLARAHSCDDDTLRALALSLFAGFERAE